MRSKISTEAQDARDGIGPAGAEKHLGPDFELSDTAGRPVRLSDYRGVKPVVLVLNRGFA